MKFYIGVTDSDWYNYLSNINPEDVNFWQPGGSSNFKAISGGAPFLFKLKYPENKIAGIGFFFKYTKLPLSIAWDAFLTRNGCVSFQEFRDRIIGYRKDKNESNPEIGCIVLTNPIFFKEEDWIDAPEDWSKNIVAGKTYDSDAGYGKELWVKIEHLLARYLNSELDISKSLSIVEEPSTPEYNLILSKVRIGQGAFRVSVTDAYNRRCSITGERTLPVLEAAHIKPYAESGPNTASNGLFLRSDIHKLFDSGYITITKNHRIEVSRRIKEEFENGKEYYRYEGKELSYLPIIEKEKPDSRFIEWHNTHAYQG